MRAHRSAYPTSQRPDRLRPSGSLLPSAARPRRRRVQLGAAGAAGLAAAGGLAAVVATSATAAPAPAPQVSGAAIRGLGAAASAEVAGVQAAQAAAAQAAAAQAAAAQAAAAAAAAAAAKAAASRSEQRAALSSTSGSFSGEASWYGPGFAGHRTASGATYEPSALTAASRSLPLGSHLRVCHGSACVTVLIDDRGPFVGGRILDLSEAAARDIGISGVGRVTCTPVG